MARAVALVLALLAVCAPLWGACEHSATSLRRKGRGSEGDEARFGDFEPMHERGTKRSASDPKSRDMDSDSEDQEEASDDDSELMKDLLQAEGIDVLPNGGFQFDKGYVAYFGDMQCPKELRIKNKTDCDKAVKVLRHKASKLRDDADAAQQQANSDTSVLEGLMMMEASLRGDDEPECIGSVDVVEESAMTICKPCDESMTSAMVSLEGGFFCGDEKEMNAEKSAAPKRLLSSALKIIGCLKGNTRAC